VFTEDFNAISELKLDEKHYPKLCKLKKEDPARFSTVLLSVRDQCLEMSWVEIANKIEVAETMRISGVEIDIVSFPAIYCWNSHKPKEFLGFFEDTVEKLWSGDKLQALKELEEFFEKRFKRG
jgi:hypothetical protein